MTPYKVRCIKTSVPAGYDLTDLEPCVVSGKIYTVTSSDIVPATGEAYYTLAEKTNYGKYKASSFTQVRINELFLHTIENGLLLSWFEEKDFNASLSVKWRGLLLHLNPKVETAPFSRSITVTLFMEGEKYYFGIGFSSRGHGSIGKQPTIETSTHSLKISVGRKGVRLLETRKDGIAGYTDSEPPFQILDKNVVIEEFVSNEELQRQFKERKKLNEVSLYEYKDNSINRNSLAYFDKSDFIVDYWTLGDHFEREKLIIIKGNNLKSLYEAIEIKDANKSELLIAIHNMFKGETCFIDYERFLNLSKINYDKKGRYDI